MNIKKTALLPEDATFIMPEKEIPRLTQRITKTEIIGQPRALTALKIGTEIRSQGYNLFVTGQSGTGRHTAVKKVLSEYKPEEKRLKDIAYVYNYIHPENPHVLYFAPGKADAFKKDVHQLVENLKLLIKSRLESDHYRDQRDEIVRIIEQQENHVLSGFEIKLSNDHFRILYVEEGEDRATDIIPVYKGKQITFDELHSLVASGEIEEAYWNEQREKYYGYMDEMKKVFEELREARNTMEDELEALKLETVKPVIEQEVQQLKKEYKGEKIGVYLSELEQDLLANVYLFLLDQQVQDEMGNPRLVRYGVNIIEDCSHIGNVPVIYENHPTYVNLFGSIDSHMESGGETRTSFMMIQAGSIIKASGGFIVIKAEDLFNEEDSWYHLKRVLQTGKVEIQHNIGPFHLPGALLKPEPIEIDVKVIIIGNENLYDALYERDPEFQKYFKLNAEFARVMDRTEDALAQYISFMKTVTAEESLLPVSDSGICSIIEYGVRLAEDRNKLSTRFSQIADVLRESNYWARKNGRKEIDRKMIRTAIEKKNYLCNGEEEKMDEMILAGDLLVKVEGKAVGKVNGLAIYERGFYAFSRPVVISAGTAPGGKGVINIEREAGLSGEIYNKGMLILEGFLRSRYAVTFPLSIHASICFEQSYGEIDGDSASSTEIYALLSSITGIPLRQDIAVTGSVNQAGEIQPVGGITEKVEGFFRICKKTGLTGSQGVIIPVQNKRNLILSEEVCGAIKEKQFFVYPVRNIDEGIEILTGMDAGEPDGHGFPEGTFNAAAAARLRDMAEQVRYFSKIK